MVEVTVVVQLDVCISKIGNGLSIQVRVRERDDHTMLDFGMCNFPN